MWIIASYWKDKIRLRCRGIRPDSFPGRHRFGRVGFNPLGVAISTAIQSIILLILPGTGAAILSI